MKRKNLWINLGSLTLILALSVCWIPCTEAQTGPKAAQKFTWIFASVPGPSALTWPFYPYPRFQKLLEQRSGGRLVLQTKMGLFPPTEVVHAVIAGRADMGLERIPWISGTFPNWDLALPFFWDHIYEFEAFVNDSRMREIDKKIYGEKGLVNIGYSPVEALDSIWSKKEIDQVAKFKGVKIRTAGLIPTLALQRMGASTLTMPTTEIMEALQRGTVDAIQTSRGWGLGFGLNDVCGYVNIWRVQSVFPGVLMVNKAKFEALPPDLQKILLDTGREMQGQTFFAAKVEEYEAIIGVKASRVKEIQPEQAEINKARELCKPVIDGWLKLAGPYGTQILSIAAQYASGAKVMLQK